MSLQQQTCVSTPELRCITFSENPYSPDKELCCLRKYDVNKR